jgi:Rrf2 family transcriptional regulator, cysteine metabolism repressor
MKLSTRSRYGACLMFELALYYGQGTIYLKDICKRQNISEKYLSNLIVPLKGAGLLISYRGAQGGYKLAKSPAEITMRQVVSVLEGEILLEGNTDNKNASESSENCPAFDVWKNLEKKIFEYLESVTLENLVDNWVEKKNMAAQMYFI